MVMRILVRISHPFAYFVLLESVHIRKEAQMAYFSQFWPIFSSFDFRSYMHTHSLTLNQRSVPVSPLGKAIASCTAITGVSFGYFARKVYPWQRPHHVRTLHDVRCTPRVQARTCVHNMNARCIVISLRRTSGNCIGIPCHHFRLQHSCRERRV